MRFASLGEIRSRYSVTSAERVKRYNDRYMEYHRGDCEGQCEGRMMAVKWYGSMTAYHWDRKEGTEDPNRDREFCDECGAEHIAYWTEMWAEYHAGLL